jgi:pimeloyl-ACP methyl ester carboxylesterase
LPKVQINNIGINYILSGSGPAILFVHGYTDSSKFWAPQVEFFSRRHTAIAVDLRGHGQSDAPAGDYSIPDFSADIFSFLQKLNIKRTWVLGHSMGGMIAQQFYTEYPEYVEGLILCSTASSGRAMKDAGGFDCLDAIEEIKQDGFEASARNAARYLFARTASAEVINFAISEELKTSREAALGAPRGMWDWSVEGKLSTISIPTLIIVGDQDQATPLSCSEALNRAIVKSQLRIIENCGHMIPVEKPHELSVVVRDFLSTHVALN